MKARILILLALAVACKKNETEKPVRHCVDKDRVVVEASRCEQQQAGSGGGFLWYYMMYHALTGSRASGGTTVAPVSGFVNHVSPSRSPAPAAQSKPTEVPRSSAPIRSFSSTPSTPSHSRPVTIPKSSAPIRSFSSSPSRSRSYSSSPSRSSARYR